MLAFNSRCRSWMIRKTMRRSKATRASSSSVAIAVLLGKAQYHVGPRMQRACARPVVITRAVFVKALVTELEVANDFVVVTNRATAYTDAKNHLAPPSHPRMTRPEGSRT